MSVGLDSGATATDLERFCQCLGDCPCGEEDVHEWRWDESVATDTSQLSQKNLEVKFHPGYSNGTSAVRGNMPLIKGRHYYWEIKMITEIYGTDVMVGVGTKKAELEARHEFRSLLGENRESWGFSYKGKIQHGGEQKCYGQKFGQGSIVGVHLDTWQGTLQFFLNRKPLGIAFTGLHSVELYPMVSSTAATSKIRIAQSCSAPASLQMECLARLKPVHRAYLTAAFPGLRPMLRSVFSEILRTKIGGNEDDDYEYEFPEEYMILDEFDFALIGFGRRKKRKLNNSSVLKSIELI